MDTWDRKSEKKKESIFRHPLLVAIVSAVVGAVLTLGLSYNSTQKSLVAEFEAGRQAGLAEAAEILAGDVAVESTSGRVSDPVSEKPDEPDDTSSENEEPPPPAGAISLTKLDTTHYFLGSDGITFNDSFTVSKDFGVALTDYNNVYYDNCLADVTNRNGGMRYDKIYQVFYVYEYDTLHFDLAISKSFRQNECQSNVRIYNLIDIESKAMESLFDSGTITKDSEFDQEGYTIDISNVDNLYIEINQIKGEGYTIIGDAKVTKEQ